MFVFPGFVIIFFNIRYFVKKFLFYFRNLWPSIKSLFACLLCDEEFKANKNGSVAMKKISTKGENENKLL